MNDFRAFAQSDFVELQPGATASELSAFEARSGLSLPSQLRTFYQLSNGATVLQGEMIILSLAEALSQFRDMREYGVPQAWGYFPFADCNNSDPYCVCCSDPVRGRIVQVFHDDAAQLRFSNISRFLDATAGAAAAIAVCTDPDRENVEDLGRLDGEYVHRLERTEDEVSTGLSLVQLADHLTDVEMRDAQRFAIDLFSEAEIGKVIHLLETGNEYVVEKARARLETMRSPEASKALEQYDRETATFVSDCVAALRAAGLHVTDVRTHTACMSPGPLWLNFPIWFHRRHEAGIQDVVVRRAKELLALHQG